MFENRFTGQSAIVTGGADGIGKQIAARFLREGAVVTLLDNDAGKLAATLGELGQGARSIVADVTEESSVQIAFSEVAKKEGKIDIVVNCAGIVGPNATKAEDVSVEDFDRVYRVNLRGSFLVAREAIRHMKPHGYGRVLLIASIAGKEGNAGMSPYSTSKAGVIGLTKALGKECAESGITINAVAPATIRTAMVEAMDPWQVNYMLERIPMKRFGTLEEIAALSCWIVSREASFNTGFVFDMTGGRATY